jgi:FlaA1/EpsC-like NDP-sugar epimerase
MLMAVRPARILEMNNGKQETAMNYFVTGATGFIGKRLVACLLARPAHRLFPDSRTEACRPPGIVSNTGAVTPAA